MIRDHNWRVSARVETRLSVSSAACRSVEIGIYDSDFDTLAGVSSRVPDISAVPTRSAGVNGTLIV